MTEEIKKRDIFSTITGLISGEVAESNVHMSSGLIPLELAPNPIVFITSTRFLNMLKLYPWQYEIIRDFFELLCPHCNDPKDIADASQTKTEEQIKSQILFEYNVCPECGLRKMDIIDELADYNELIGVLGMRSGKGVCAACISAAILHEALWVEDLSEKLGVLPGQLLEGSFLAASSKQATKTVHAQFRAMYDRSPWFQDYKKTMLDLEISNPSLRRGDLYHQTDTLLFFKYKNISIESSHSNSATLAGSTRMFLTIDELSRFDEGGAKQSATEVYRVMKNSLLTMKVLVKKARQRGDYSLPDAKMICISSPIFADDKMMQLLKIAKDQVRMLSCHKTTWDANPDIDEEDLEDAYLADPIGAERDFGANPPGAENPFIKDNRLIKVCTDPDRHSIFTLRESFFEQKIQDMVFNYLKLDVINVRYRNLIDYVVACDPGRAGDSFAITIAHIEEDVVYIDGSIEGRPIPKGNRAKLVPRQVHFPSMTNIIIKLNNKLSIKYVSYDRWNSLGEIDRLRDNKILAIGKNLDRDDHIKFYESMRLGKIRFPCKEAENVDPKTTRNVPIVKALHELSRLEDDGRKVDHPSGGSNDIIQTWVACHRLLITPEKVLDKKRMLEQQYRANIKGRHNIQRTKLVRINRFI